MRIAVIVGRPSFATGGNPLPYSDRCAIDLAVNHLRGSVTVYVAGEDVQAQRYAVAAGAACATSLPAPGALGFDLLLIGQGGCGATGDLLPATYAEAGGAALLLEVLELSRTNAAWVVVRDLGRGARERLKVSGPLVALVSELAPRPAYVSVHRRRVASLPQSLAAQPRIPEAAGWTRTRPRVKVADHAEASPGAPVDRLHKLAGLDDEPSEDGAEVIIADAGACARHLIRYLCHLGFLARDAGLSVAGPPPERPAAQPKPRSTAAFAATAAGNRGPRPLDRAAPGLSRRPTAPAPALPPGYLRRPRRLGRTRPSTRGPFRCTMVTATAERSDNA